MNTLAGILEWWDTHVNHAFLDTGSPARWLRDQLRGIRYKWADR